MKAFIAGIANISGVSKSTQAPFEMTKLYVLNPIENVSKQNFSKRGVGYGFAEFDATPEAILSIEKVKLPGIYELITGVVMFGGKMVTVVTGVVEKPPVVA